MGIALLSVIASEYFIAISSTYQTALALCCSFVSLYSKVHVLDILYSVIALNTCTLMYNSYKYTGIRDVVSEHASRMHH